MEFLQSIYGIALIIITTCVVGFFLYAFVFSSSSPSTPPTPWSVKYMAKSGGDMWLDVKRGLIILGSAGSGKSMSGFWPIFKHGAENKISIINYDYKDWELTEFLIYYYKKYAPEIPIYNISPAHPDLSHHINPIDPKYMQTFDDINTVSKALVSNLAPDDGGGGKIFAEIAESAVAGCIQKLKESYPDKCSLPYLTAVLMLKEGEDLINFIKSSQYASLLGVSFIESFANEKLFGSVKTTLSNALRKIVSPEMFMIFKDSDFDMAINRKDNISVLNLINHPKYDVVFAPFLAVVARCAIMQCSERDRNPLIFCNDEASTWKLDKIERIPATLRSYGIGTVVGLQDKVQGKMLYSDDIMKALMANLGSKIIGKANDKDTAKWYEDLFELIEIDQKSISKGSGWSSGGEARESVSKKEVAKHRAAEFYKLKAGQFFVFDEKGDNRKVDFKAYECIATKPKPVYNYSKLELKENFDFILEDGKNLQ